MKIKWFGQSSFMMTSENGTKIVTDPYADFLGYKLPGIEADIVSTSHDHRDHNNIGAVKGRFEHIREPGRFSNCGIEINGVETFHDNVSGAKKGKNIVYTFAMDQIKVCHCGDLGHVLSSGQIKDIGKVDILLLPVGGSFTINASDAFQVMKQLNPAIVIPMHYRTKALGLMGHVFGKVDDFIAIAGMKATKYKELEVNKENINEYAGIAVLEYN